MSRFKILAACAGLAASLAAPASACRPAIMQDMAPPNLILIGEAVEVINIEYMDNLPDGYVGESIVTASTVKFKVITVLQGDYAYEAINATFKSAFASPPPTDLTKLRSGGDHQSLIGLYTTGPDTPQQANVWSEICEPHYFMLKPTKGSSQRDKDNWALAVKNAPQQK